MPGVSTMLMPTGLPVSLDLGDGGYFVFAHPVWWLDRSIKPEIGMDASNAWGDVERVKADFWELVAPVLRWSPAGDLSAHVMLRGKQAQRTRDEKSAGHISLFD